MHTGKTLSKWLKSEGVWVLLAVIVVVGTALRLYDVQWDSGIMAHPDERSTVAFYAPTMEWPNSLSEALNPHRSPLNPFWDNHVQHRRSYTYGHFPLYLLVLVGNFLGAERAQVGFESEGNRRRLVVPKKIIGEVEPISGANPDETVKISNTQYWMGPEIVVAQATQSRVRAFGRVWDFEGRSAEICAIDWSGP